MTKPSRIAQRFDDRMSGVVGYEEEMTAEDILITGMIDWMGKGNLGNALSLCDEMVSRYGTAENALEVLRSDAIKLKRDSTGKFKLEHRLS
jgi:hypothetical protein